MGLEKSKLKQQLIHGIGIKVDDMLDACIREKQQLAGGKVAADQIAKLIDSLNSYADKDLDTGDIPSLEVLAIVKKYIHRAYMAAVGTSDNFQNQELMSAGKQDFATKIIGFLKGMHDEEEKKAKALEQDSDGGPRPTGRRPGASVAQQRKKEEASEKKAPPTKRTTKNKKKTSGKDKG